MIDAGRLRRAGEFRKQEEGVGGVDMSEMVKLGCFNSPQMDKLHKKYSFRINCRCFLDNAAQCLLSPLPRWQWKWNCQIGGIHVKNARITRFVRWLEFDPRKYTALYRPGQFLISTVTCSFPSLNGATSFLSRVLSG